MTAVTDDSVDVFQTVQHSHQQEARCARRDL